MTVSLPHITGRAPEPFLPGQQAKRPDTPRPPSLRPLHRQKQAGADARRDHRALRASQVTGGLTMIKKGAWVIAVTPGR